MHISNNNIEVTRTAQLPNVLPCAHYTLMSGREGEARRLWSEKYNNTRLPNKMQGRALLWSIAGAATRISISIRIRITFHSSFKIQCWALQPRCRVGSCAVCSRSRVRCWCKARLTARRAAGTDQLIVADAYHTCSWRRDWGCWAACERLHLRGQWRTHTTRRRAISGARARSPAPASAARARPWRTSRTASRWWLVPLAPRLCAVLLCSALPRPVRLRY